MHSPRKSAAADPKGRCPSWKCWGSMACSPLGGGSEATAAAAAAADGPRAKMLSMEKLEDELAAVGGDGGPRKGAV